MLNFCIQVQIMRKKLLGREAFSAVWPTPRSKRKICPPPASAPVIRVSNNIVHLGPPKEGPKPLQLLSLPPFPGHPLPGRNSTSAAYVTAISWLRYYFNEILPLQIQKHFHGGLVRILSLQFLLLLLASLVLNVAFIFHLITGLLSCLFSFSIWRPFLINALKIIFFYVKTIDTNDNFTGFNRCRLNVEVQVVVGQGAMKDNQCPWRRLELIMLLEDDFKNPRSFWEG